MSTDTFKIILIFAIRPEAAELAHVSGHRVAGIALPPADANFSFHQLNGFKPFTGEESPIHLPLHYPSGRKLHFTVA